MADEKMKACEKCGHEKSYKIGGYVGCTRCGHSDVSEEVWNRRAMPECVRELLDYWDGDPQHADYTVMGMDKRMRDVRKYYGEGE